MGKEQMYYQDELVTMRRDLHKIPEVGTDLRETCAYVMKKLDEYGIGYRYLESVSGIIATINPGKGHVLALRADMDALRVTEDTGLPFASTHPGMMHACGHDAHTAMLLGAAKILAGKKEELDKEIRLIFQPNEEGMHGAEEMIKAGAMEGVEAVFGMHIGTFMGTEIPSGNLVVMPGPNMASCDFFHLTVKGKGCHASMPEKGLDPITMASHIVLGLEEIIAREFSALDSVVVTLGRINGGFMPNVIPDEVKLSGTTRTFDNAVRERVEKRIGEIASNMAAAFGGTVEYEYELGNGPVINDEAMTELACQCACDVLGKECVVTKTRPTMVAEDFARYLELAPGAFLQLSTADSKKGCAYAHHSAKFDIDEVQLWKGTALFTELAKRF